MSGERKSIYPCPHCGEHKLSHPDIKGEYGWFDVSKYICSACNRESPSEKVRELGRAANAAASEVTNGNR